MKFSRVERKESISRLIERELKPKSKVQADIDKLDADIARSKNPDVHSAQVKKSWGYRSIFEYFVRCLITHNHVI